MEIARGNFNARVPLNQGNVLWSIAGSLNNLLARVQHWRQDSSQLQRTEQAIQQLRREMQLARTQGKPIQLSKTGTAVDLLLLDLLIEKPLYQTSSASVAENRSQMPPGKNNF
jgi:hypothetical protein